MTQSFNNTTIASELYPVANGITSSSPFVVVFQTRDPTTSDIQYPIQKVWLNTSTENFWFLQNFTTSAGVVFAHWIPFSGFATVESLRDQTGIDVFPDVTNEINVIGDNTFIKTVGTPGTNTLTIQQIAGFPSNFAFNYTNVTHAMSPYTVVTSPSASADYYISVDCSSGTVALNFPNAPNFKQLWIVKDRTGNASTNNITITTPGGTVTFDGLTTYTMNSNYQAINILANAIPTYEVY